MHADSAALNALEAAQVAVDRKSAELRGQSTGE